MFFVYYLSQNCVTWLCFYIFVYLSHNKKGERSRPFCDASLLSCHRSLTQAETSGIEVHGRMSEVQTGGQSVYAGFCGKFAVFLMFTIKSQQPTTHSNNCCVALLAAVRFIYLFIYFSGYRLPSPHHVMLMTTLQWSIVNLLLMSSGTLPHPPFSCELL